MKEFNVEQYGGKLHICSDGWSTTGDPDTVRRELDKWLDECTELDA